MINTALSRLDLSHSHNNISNAGATALAGALATNTALTVFLLSSIILGAAGHKALPEALAVNVGLKSLTLFGTDDFKADRPAFVATCVEGQPAASRSQWVR